MQHKFLFQDILLPGDDVQEGSVSHNSSKLRNNTNISETEDDIVGHGDGEVPTDTSPDTQQFFPSFAPLFPPLGHSRPPVLFQEPAHSQRPALLRPQHNNFQNLGFSTGPFRDASYLRTPTASAEPSAVSGNLLGSGNFGVIRGGTYYNEDDQQEGTDFSSGDGHSFSPYYSNNGHGRPIFYNPRPRPHGNDFFANFRDFADINTPPKSSYSEYYVVYVNKNATHNDIAHSVPVSGKSKPKNIIEQLAMLDHDTKLNNENTSNLKNDKTLKIENKPGKRKLNLYYESNKLKSKKIISNISNIHKDLYEPLLALS